MILDDPLGTPPIAGGVTLDELFRRAAARTPAGIALVDPSNRASVTGGAPLRLTYAQADRCIAAIAARLRDIGLATDAIVGLQTANTLDGVLALLAVLRAGLIAMPMPLLWRQADAVAALSRVGAHALIVSGRIGETDHYDLALDIAAEVFTVRQVCGFGDHPPDGAVPLDDLTAPHMIEPIAPIDRECAPSGRGAHVAVITWDVCAAGPVSVARSHAELIAGGLAVQLEARMEQHAKIHTSVTLSSFAGLAVALVPWLLVGGMLVLHHPFEAETFGAQAQAIGCDTAVVPGPLVAPLAQAGLFSARAGLKRVLSVWRTPERLTRAPGWREPGIAMIDVPVFGEIGLIAAGRGADGRPGAIARGQRRSRGADSTARVAGEVKATPAGTLGLRGPMVPTCAFPPGAARAGLPCHKASADGYVDTGYICRAEPNVTVTAPPPGLVAVGGYRFVPHELDALMSQADASLAVLPDALTGQRLAVAAGERAAVRQSLASRGANALVVGAFRDPIRTLTSR
jgi:hypothetical protein